MMTFNFGYEGGYVYKDNLELLHPIPNLSHIDCKFDQESFRDVQRDVLYFTDVLPERKIPQAIPESVKLPGYSYADEHIKTIFLQNIVKNAKIDLDVKFYSLDYLFLNPDIKFFYHVALYSGEMFTNLDNVSLPPLLIQCIKRKQAKILFTMVTEGFFGDYLIVAPTPSNPDNVNLTPSSFFNFIHKILDKYNLPNKSIIVVTANLLADFTYSFDFSENKKRFTILPLDWFRYSKWVNGRRYRPNFLQEIYDRIEEKRTAEIHKHFLCLNRVHRHHRAVMFSEFMSNKVLKDKVYLSYKKNDSQYDDFLVRQLAILKNTYKHGKDRLIHFALNYDFTKDYVLDTENMHINLADTFATFHHKHSFVNVVTETLISNMSIFFSEKIHKPIKAGQPFILVGNPGSLLKMKELGYKTFSDFWDESYDTEPNFTVRIEKIIDVLVKISSWSEEKCKSIYEQMIPILEHNARVFCDDTGYFEFLKKLEFFHTKQVL